MACVMLKEILQVIIYINNILKLKQAIVYPLNHPKYIGIVYTFQPVCGLRYCKM